MTTTTSRAATAGEYVMLACGHARRITFNDPSPRSAQRYWCDRCDGSRPPAPPVPPVTVTWRVVTDYQADIDPRVLEAAIGAATRADLTDDRAGLADCIGHLAAGGATLTADDHAWLCERLAWYAGDVLAGLETRTRRLEPTGDATVLTITPAPTPEGTDTR